MKSNLFVLMSLVVALAFGSVFAFSYDAFASHSFDLEQRRIERELAREERRAEREARRASRSVKEPSCRCNARLKFSKPELSWRSGQLVLVPRVDIDIRTRGNTVSDPSWKAHLTYSGSAAYASSDVTVSNSPVLFSGQREIASGMCGDNRYSFKGYALPPVALAGLTSNLLNVNQKVDGTVKMDAKITGCGTEEEARAFQFTAKGLSNLDVGRWRRVR